MSITTEQVKSLVSPGGKAAIIKETVALFNQYADDYGINTPLRKAHFLAQLAHESDHFNTTKEYGGASKRYAPWFGRGLIQVTWEENYVEFYEWAAKAGLNPPEFFTAEGRDKAALFPWAFWGAIWYWTKHKLNALADRDDVLAITKKINGGTNGLDDRKRYLAKAKQIFGVTGSAPADDDGYKVIDIQRALIERGFRIDADGRNGPKTNAAVRLFQKMNGLTADGVVGPKTAKMLGL